MSRLKGSKNKYVPLVGDAHSWEQKCIELENENNKLSVEIFTLKKELETEKKKALKIIKRLREKENNLSGE